MRQAKLKIIASDMKSAKDWDEIGDSIDDVVGKLQAHKRRLDAQKMAKKKSSARQAGVMQFFKKKPKKPAEVQL